jgi:hypothetical protein
MTNLVITFSLYKVTELNGKKHHYAEFFNSKQLSQLKLFYSEEVVSIDLPISNSKSVKKIFEELFSNRISNSSVKILPILTAYDFTDDDAIRARKWFNYYRGYGADIIMNQKGV